MSAFFTFSYKYITIHLNDNIIYLDFDGNAIQKYRALVQNPVDLCITQDLFRGRNRRNSYCVPVGKSNFIVSRNINNTKIFIR